MTFGEKIRKARAQAGFTQEELADKLMVSRAAVAKWESGRGMPDITNLKAIAQALNVSVDYLLDDGGVLDLSETRKPIDLRKYGDSGRLSRLKKVKIKERIVRGEFPKAEIIRLTLTGIRNTERETVVDLVLGWFVLILGNIPLFGTQEFGKMVSSLDQQYYLVNEEKKQYFVLLTDEHVIIRALADRISEKKFTVGDRTFLVVGKVE